MKMTHPSVAFSSLTSMFPVTTPTQTLVVVTMLGLPKSPYKCIVTLCPQSPLLSDENSSS